jgi:hypothetical protein
MVEFIILVLCIYSSLKWIQGLLAFAPFTNLKVFLTFMCTNMLYHVIDVTLQKWFLSHGAVHCALRLHVIGQENTRNNFTIRLILMFIEVLVITELQWKLWFYIQPAAPQYCKHTYHANTSNPLCACRYANLNTLNIMHGSVLGCLLWNL